MPDFFKKIKTLIQTRTTYKVGLLQDKAYRILKQETTRALTSSGISAVEWALLGLLVENPDGFRFGVLSDELGVEAPFVTVMVKHLKKIGYVVEKPDEKDSRAKKVVIAEKGKAFVVTTEAMLRAYMKRLIKDVKPQDLAGYITVLKLIIHNFEHNSLSGD